jgi:replicative superfamily II helicase
MSTPKKGGTPLQAVHVLGDDQGSMVDFRKRIGKAGGTKPLDPIEIYSGLDRASDKGPLRPAQLAVLQEWHAGRRGNRDTILKLHTGQGKTLIGLLILQSKLNEGKGPTLYLCPNNFLIEQTCDQAKQFGLKVVTPDDDGELPSEFLESKSILVTSIQKLFNGFTKFRLGARSVPVATLVLDDAHACIDSIREACTITIGYESTAYAEIRELFDSDLRAQGAGTFADLRRNEWNAFLPVPYWAWFDKSDDVARIVSRHSDTREIKFVWPLLKDSLQDCHCMISGTSLEVHPHLAPLDVFGTYSKAECRVFMSATVTDDSFLVKGLGLDAHVIRSPLVFNQEKWSGEKMVLIPSLVDPSLERSEIVKMFAAPTPRRTVGVVALCPSLERTRDWEKYGALVCTRGDIYENVERLKQGLYDKTVVLANRYDGIDLPDATCRILILDSRPFAESILDRYLERCLGNTEAIATKVARRIEQGLGRSVRGEKDYCVILLIGTDLVAQMKTPSLRGYFSPQTRMQVEIGLEIAKFSREDAGDEPAKELLTGLIDQCLSRDEGWKEYYVGQMNALTGASAPPGNRLGVYEKELQAERRSLARDYAGAATIILEVADKLVSDEAEKAWYLQEAARYYYRASKLESDKFQQAAHERNHLLLWPREGATVRKMTPLPQQRIDRIIEWLSSFSTSAEMLIELDAVVGALNFGVGADKFEAALDQLGRILGFATERPDMEWKEGPDNLWCLRENEYIFFECKSQVELTRAEISKYETEQINSSSAWFTRHYPDAAVTRILVIPTKQLAASSDFLLDTVIMRKRSLDLLIKNVRSFFGEFREDAPRSISERRVNAAIIAHHLTVDEMMTRYSERPT